MPVESVVLYYNILILCGYCVYCLRYTHCAIEPITSQTRSQQSAQLEFNYIIIAICNKGNIHVKLVFNSFNMHNCGKHLIIVNKGACVKIYNVVELVGFKMVILIIDFSRMNGHQAFK